MASWVTSTTTTTTGLAAVVGLALRNCYKYYIAGVW
jgi:hypothetical protein